MDEIDPGEWSPIPGRRAGGMADKLVALSSCTTTRNNIEMPNQTFSKEDKCWSPCPQVPCPFVLSSIINWCIIFFL